MSFFVFNPFFQFLWQEKLWIQFVLMTVPLPLEIFGFEFDLDTLLAKIVFKFFDL